MLGCLYIQQRMLNKRRKIGKWHILLYKLCMYYLNSILLDNLYRLQGQKKCKIGKTVQCRQCIGLSLRHNRKDKLHTSCHYCMKLKPHMLNSRNYKYNRPCNLCMKSDQLLSKLCKEGHNFECKSKMKIKYILRYRLDNH